MNLNRFLITLSVLIFSAGINFGYHAFASYGNAIYSTEEGGYWHDPDTWIGEVTPTGLDSVIINGPVKLASSYANLEAASLNINSGGSISDGYYHLKVFGDVVNKGSIIDAPIEVGGNITNDGIWQENRIYLIGGSSTREILTNKPIDTDIVLEDDITILNSPQFGSELNLNDNILTVEGDTLTLFDDFRISSGGGIVANDIVFAGDNQVFSAGNSTIEVNTIFFSGGGQKTMGTSLLKIQGDVIVNPGVEIYNVSFPLRIFGDITNNGTITKSMEVFGNIENNGVWENDKNTKLCWLKDENANEYEFLITDESGLWQDPIQIAQSSYDDFLCYKAEGLINESRSWKVQSKYSDSGSGEWSEIHTINAGNLFIDASKLFDKQKDSAIDTNNISVTAAEISFSDVPENAFYKTELSDLTNAEIINGYSDGTFKPNQTINRAELLKIAMIAGGLDAEEGEVKTYSDVKSSDWFNSYIQAATKYGIVKGYSDGSFRPGNLINMAEAIKVIILSTQPSGNNCSGNMRFNDVNQSDWFYDYVCRAEQLGILNMVNDNFEPGKEITRAEVVYWVGQLFD